MDPFIARVAETIDRFGLLPGGGRVVVAVSGGPDSTALLAALAELAPQRGYRLFAAHLDHGLREGSADDARFVQEQARSFGVELTLERCDVARLARRWGTSLEAAGRRARYRFLRRAAAARQCRTIAVGHHRDDQVETVLLNLLAGAGTDGVAGMRPRRGDVVRPLFERRRAEILAFLHRRGLRYLTDPSNTDPAFARNRVRGELLPLLRQRFNPRVDDALWRASRLAADEVDYLAELADELFRSARASLPGGLWLTSAVLRAAPPALRRRVLRRAFWEAAAGAGTGPEHPTASEPTAPPDRLGSLALHHVEALDALLTVSSGSLDLPAGLRATAEQGFLCFRRLADRGGGGRTGNGGNLPDDARPEPRELPVPGAVPWAPPWAGIAAEVLDASLPGHRPPYRPGHAYLDYDRMGAPAALYVRTWLPGDRMQPLGAPGSRKLQDLFVDRKLPRSLRRRVPVITLGDTIVWVPGAAVAEPFRITRESRRILHLHLAGADPEVLR